jgi:uncharacterized protein (DUF983 family)
MTVYPDTSAGVAPDALPHPQRPLQPAIWRGLKMCCPACGAGRLFYRYLKVVDRCPSCGEEMYHQRADDAPPYFTIFLVGHVVVPLVIVVERLWHPELWVHFSLWVPLVLAMSLLILPLVKGGIVGLQWALCMHGFELAARCRAVAPQEP